MLPSLYVIDREKELFFEDITHHEHELHCAVSTSRFLVLGGAGSIGQAVTKEIFRRNPQKLHVVDINENNLVELVRDIRSSFGYIPGDFQTFVLDVGTIEYDTFIAADGGYDYVLNLSALKHVRSERDAYTLMRLINTNILNTEKTLLQSIAHRAAKYFCVSTDKAANPVNMMGASKRIMEMFLMRRSLEITVSTARFANVAFSDGSLLYGFEQRLQKRQPIVAPKDIKRYFISPKEAGELCLLSCILGENRDIFFPRLSAELKLVSLAEVAIRYLKLKGYEPIVCESEDEARSKCQSLPDHGKWPCLFDDSDTTGEKSFEEFFTRNEKLDMSRFKSMGIIKYPPIFEDNLLRMFINRIQEMKQVGFWNKEELVELFVRMIPEFSHAERGKYLDNKM